MKNIQLIALDLDKTLLDNQKRLPEQNKEAVEYAISKGVHITLASGRYYNGMRSIADELDVDMPIICGNGAEIRKTNGEVVFGKYLDTDVCKNLIDIAIEFDLVFNVYAHDTIITLEPNDGTGYYEMLNKDLSADNKCRLLYTNDIMEFVTNPPADISTGVLKLEYRNIGEDRAESLRKVIEQIPGIAVEGLFTKNIELHADNVSKGTGLQAVAKYAGIDMKNVMAFGDYVNDIPMLESAGFSVAMGNADETTKAAASYIAASNEECGVAKTIYKFI